eukprot:2666766-Rhodomonas_salina.2
MVPFERRRKRLVQSVMSPVSTHTTSSARTRPLNDRSNAAGWQKPGVSGCCVLVSSPWSGASCHAPEVRTECHI